MYFIDSLINSKQLSLNEATLRRLDELYGLSTAKNVEINFRFLMLCLKYNFRPVLPSVASFLSRHGRGLYVKPLYKRLAAFDFDFARRTYADNKLYYHAVIRAACGKGMNLE